MADLKEIAEIKTRHYDTLFYTVTKIIAAAIGGLLVYCYNQSNVNKILVFVGSVLTVIPVYYAASFRELRQLLEKNILGDDPNHIQIREIFKERQFRHQWALYPLIFIMIEFFWINLLLKLFHNLYDRHLIIGIGILEIILMVHWSYKVRGKKKIQTNSAT